MQCLDSGTIVKSKRGDAARACEEALLRPGRGLVKRPCCDLRNVVAGHSYDLKQRRPSCRTVKKEVPNIIKKRGGAMAPGPATEVLRRGPAAHVLFCTCNALKAAPYDLKFKFRGGGLFSTAQGCEGLEGGAWRKLRPPH